MYHPTTRFRNRDRLFAHGLDNAAGWNLSDHSSTRNQRESQVPPPNIAIFERSKKLWATRTGRRWHPGPIQTLLATGLSAFLGVTLVILAQDIHPAPDKLTLQKDAAELASLETHSRMDSLPSATAGNAEIDRVAEQPEERPQPEAPKSKLIASRASSVDRKRDTDSSVARKQLRVFKRDLEGRPDKVRNPQRQTAVPFTRQRYEQRGLNSFFAAIGHALGFSSN
jgi:hypothetical protein